MKSSRGLSRCVVPAGDTLTRDHVLRQPGVSASRSSQGRRGCRARAPTTCRLSWCSGEVRRLGLGLPGGIRGRRARRRRSASPTGDRGCRSCTTPPCYRCRCARGCRSCRCRRSRRSRPHATTEPDSPAVPPNVTIPLPMMVVPFINHSTSAPEELSRHSRSALPSPLKSPTPAMLQFAARADRNSAGVEIAAADDGRAVHLPFGDFADVLRQMMSACRRRRSRRSRQRSMRRRGRPRPAGVNVAAARDHRAVHLPSAISPEALRHRISLLPSPLKSPAPQRSTTDRGSPACRPR